jgi:hypothetical protein
MFQCLVNDVGVGKLSRSFWELLESVKAPLHIWCHRRMRSIRCMWNVLPSTLPPADNIAYRPKGTLWRISVKSSDTSMMSPASSSHMEPNLLSFPPTQMWTRVAWLYICTSIRSVQFGPVHLSCNPVQLGPTWTSKQAMPPWSAAELQPSLLGTHHSASN